MYYITQSEKFAPYDLDLTSVCTAELELRKHKTSMVISLKIYVYV